jgi:FtsZ-binding cell division protein ZapB
MYKRRPPLGLSLAITTALIAILSATDNKKELPAIEQVKILKAQHEIDEIEQKKAQLIFQFNQLTQQIEALKTQYSALDQPLKDAQKKLDDTIAIAARTIGVDMEKYTFDKKDLAFVSKATTPPPTPPAPSAPTPAPPSPKDKK